MQPSSSPTRPALPRQRSRPVGASHARPYSYGYRGPTSPYPELRARGGGSGLEDPRMPRTALIAGVLGIVGVAPLAPLTVAAVVFGGLWGDGVGAWWLYALPVIPVLELWGAIWLLGRRGWRFPALSLVPGVVMFGVMLAAQLAHRDGLGLGWYVLALVLPLFALALTLAPSVRRWIAGRPWDGRAGTPAPMEEPNVVLDAAALGLPRHAARQQEHTAG